MTAVLAAEGLHAGFGARTVLHGVDVAVEESAVVGLFGLNGAGKSVTMKVLAGLVPAQEGRVVLAGHDVTGAPVEDRARLGMAYVPQGRQLFPDLTVEQNLRLGAAVLRKRDAARARRTLAEIYDRFPRLDERRRQLAGSMSGGEQAMLAVARALAGAPRLLLLDEPSAGLAPKVIDEVFDLLASLKRDGLTMVIVEQNLSAGFRIADRAVILQTGRVVHDGAVAGLDTARVADLLGVGRLLGSQLDRATSESRHDRDRPAPRPRSTP